MSKQIPESTMTERVEGNKLIAGFMGNPSKMSDYWYERKPNYHSSWDWLMPVVEKIERCGGSFEIGSAQISWYHPGSLEPVRYCSHGGFPVSRQFEKKLQYAWQCVIQFIKWYNEQNIKSETDTIK